MAFFLILKINRLQRGQTVKLTRGDVAQVHINLIDAKKFLSKEKYEAVFNLYDKYKQDKSTEMMDIQRYKTVANEIIDEFNKIAPWSLYNGKR